MIDARKLAGVTNTSSYQVYRSSKDYYANVVTGTNGKMRLRKIIEIEAESKSGSFSGKKDRG